MYVKKKLLDLADHRIVTKTEVSSMFMHVIDKHITADEKEEEVEDNSQFNHGLRAV